MAKMSDSDYDYASGYSSGLGAIVLRVVLYCALALVAVGGYAALQFRGLSDGEAMEIAETARNLSAGNGFSTHCVRPFDLWYLQKQGVEYSSLRIPDLYHPPAYPAMLAAMYGIVRPKFEVPEGGRWFDAEIKAIVPLGVLLTLLTGLVLFLFSAHIFGRLVAGISAAVYLTSVLTLKSSISGLPLPMLSLTIVGGTGLAVLAIQMAERGKSFWLQMLAVIGVALCAGVAILTDYTMMAVAIGLVLLLAVQLQRLRWVSVILMVAVCVAVVAPWLWLNHQRGIGPLGAQAYTALEDSALYANDSLERSVSPEFNQYKVIHAVQRKVIGHVVGSFRFYGAMSGGIIICFFVLSLFHRFEDPELRWVKPYVLGVMILLLVLSPLVGPSYEVVSAVFPLLVMLGSGAFVEYLNREEYFEQGMRELLVWVLLIVSVLPAIGGVVLGGRYPYPPYYPPMQRFVGDLVASDEWVCTDIPWATAWYGDCASLLLPNTVSDVESLPEGWGGIGGVYLTKPPVNPIVTSDSWSGLWHYEVPESVPLKHAIELPSRNASQVFLSDSPAIGE